MDFRLFRRLSGTPSCIRGCAQSLLFGPVLLCAGFVRAPLHETMGSQMIQPARAGPDDRRVKRNAIPGSIRLDASADRLRAINPGGLVIFSDYVKR